MPFYTEHLCFIYIFRHFLSIKFIHNRPTHIHNNARTYLMSVFRASPTQQTSHFIYHDWYYFSYFLVFSSRASKW